MEFTTFYQNLILLKQNMRLISYIERSDFQNLINILLYKKELRSVIF